jgi:ubiquinone/menaquinone biosynthesis C-methylase UbiE
MILTPLDWHYRYTQQAKWTADLRRYLYTRLDLDQKNKILDVGCGTGVIDTELNSLYAAKVFGLDIQHTNLDLAKKYAPKSSFTLGDAHQLPFHSKHFDLTLCHFLLLWVGSPTNVVREMKRVTRPGGYVMALAEPDYGGRIDYPKELEELGKWQQESLNQQGADAQIGRRLAEIFHQADLDDVEVGVLGGQWSGDSLMEDWLTEWLILENDLTKIPEDVNNWEFYKSMDLTHRQQGDRILFVPTFFAYGQVST